MTQQPEHVEDPWAGDPGPHGATRPVPAERLPAARSRPPGQGGQHGQGGPGPGHGPGSGNGERHDRSADTHGGAPAAPVSFERVPPQDLEAEQSVLGGMMLSKDAIADVVEVLKGHDFYRPAHETVYGAILDLYAKGEPADPITVTAELTRRGEISRVGGPGYVHSLVQTVPTAANAEYYAEIVHERAVLRRLVEAGTRITQMGYAADGDVDDIVNSAQSEIYQVTEQRTSEDYLPLGDIMEGALDEIEAIGSRSGQMTGVPTGFTDLDSLTNGLHPGQMIVIAARPAMGKCVTSATRLVEARTGERMTVEEFVRRGQSGERPEVHTLTDGWKLRPVRPSDFVHNGRRPVLRLTTRLGRAISATPRHPFRTLRGWVPLEELKPGDRIAVARELPAGSSAELPSELVASTGRLLGAGSPPGGTPQPAACSADGPADTGRFTDRLAEWGLAGKGSQDTFVPGVFFRLPERQIALFLSRVYATGGWACLSESGNQPQVGYSTVSERLARDVAHLLLRLGIVAEVVGGAASCGGAGSSAYQVLIRDPDQIRTFAARVGVLSGEPQLGEVPAAFAVRERERTAWPDLDLIPGDVWDLIKEEMGDRSWAETSALAGRPRGHDWQVGQELSRHNLLELGKALESPLLVGLAESDVQWDCVKSVVPDGEDEVYDLTVEGTHSFVADDIVVHNSTLALDFSRACSVRHNMPSVIFSLEMGRNEIAMRLLSAEARVALHHMRSGSMTDEDWTRLARQMPQVTEAPLYIDDSPNLSMMEIRAKCRRLKQRNDLKLVVIDYLQLMQTGSSRRPESRQQEVSEMSRNLKLLAKELEVPVIALSQLNRGPEQRTDKKPMVSDLRESGCMTADTTILRADTGAPVTFGELMSGGYEDVSVWSLDEDRRLVPAPVTNVFPSGTKPVYKLRLASGREVKATGNHPFLTFPGWTPLEQLSVGDRIAVPRYVPEPIGSGLGWSEQRIGLLAHLIGDGRVLREQPVHYTSDDEANVAFVEAAATAEFGITPRRVEEGTSRRTCLPAPGECTHGRDDPLHAWFRELGIEDLMPHGKRIPDAVYSATDDEVGVFLRHLWATAGCVRTPEPGGESAPEVYYAASSRRLAHDVTSLLSRFGIVSCIRKVPEQGCENPGYHVVVANGPGLRTFCRRIGVHGRGGEEAERLLAGLGRQQLSTDADSLPPEVWALVDAERIRAGFTERRLRTAIGMQDRESALYETCASRARMQRCADVLDSEKLRAIASDDVFWDRVVEIEPLGEQPVFDATVKGTHNFIADGIAAHNSIEQDADMVVLLHREDAYEKESPRAGEADLIVAKHRNGPTATITVAFQGHYSRFVDMAQT